MDSLKVVVEPDGVRILEHHNTQSNVIQFLVSTNPSVSPSQCIRSIKGRLQYLLRNQDLKIFRRNYSIISIGEANAKKLDRYIDQQTNKHPMADPRMQALFESLQFYNPAIDLAEIQTGNYGQFLYSLQIVLEFSGGWHETRPDQLRRIRRIIVSCAKKHAWRLSRIGLLSNHLHVLLGADVKQTPAEIAIAMMNNVAFVYELTPVLKFSYYVGTFGGHDRGSVRKVVASNRGKLDGARDSGQ